MNNEHLYLTATEEVEQGNVHPGLWAKALALHEGDENKAKYFYINQRVAQLEKENVEQVPPESPDEEHTHKSASSVDSSVDVSETKFFLSKLIDGDYGLAKTYWLFGVVGNILVNISLFVALQIGSLPVFISIYALAIVYGLTALFGIWVAAGNYGGFVLWKYLARFMVILGFIGTFRAFITFMDIVTS